MGGSGDTGGGASGSNSEPTPIALFVLIAMGEENVTAQAFDFATGEIEIDEVTGPITVTTWAELQNS